LQALIGGKGETKAVRNVVDRLSFTQFIMLESLCKLITAHEARTLLLMLDEELNKVGRFITLKDNLVIDCTFFVADDERRNRLPNEAQTVHERIDGKQLRNAATPSKARLQD